MLRIVYFLAKRSKTELPLLVNMNKNTNKKRLSAVSTPVLSVARTTGNNDISASIEDNSPVASTTTTTSTKRRLSFDSAESDSDTEIVFTQQANKRKRMSDKEEIKMWFREEFGSKLDKLDYLATSAQVNALHAEMNKNTQGRRKTPKR